MNKAYLIHILSLCLAIMLLSSPLLKQVIPIAGAVAITNWGQFHGDSSHSGYAGSSGPTNPKQIWNYSLGGANNGLIALNGLLIASSLSDNQLLALSEASGSSTHGFDIATPGWWSPRLFIATYPAAAAGLVFFSAAGSTYLGFGAGGNGQHLIDANYLSNGQNVWTCGIPSGPTNSAYFGQSMVTYYQGIVYAVPFNSGNVTAIQSTSGVIDWQLSLPGEIDTIPTIGNNVLIIGYSDTNQVTGISANSNTTLWNCTTNGAVDASPAYDSGHFFFGTMNGTFYSVSQDGNETWSFPNCAKIETTPAVAYGLIFFGTDDGTLYALNETTGNLTWETNTGTDPLLSPAVVASNGILYQATTSKMLYAFNATNGAQLWAFPLGAGVTASPVLDNSYLFLVDSNGVVYAIADGSSPSSSSTTASSPSPGQTPSSNSSSTSSTPSSNSSSTSSSGGTPDYNYWIFLLTIVMAVVAVIGLVHQIFKKKSS